MRSIRNEEKSKVVCFSLVFFLLAGVTGVLGSQAKIGLNSLLPTLEGMESGESPKTYFPENLFEYIDGAAEIYLSYDFKELIVAEYKKSDAPDSVAVEIYDMGSQKNSFGIYSAERYPDNEFMPIGTQGYMEEGTLNFLVGRYYVKLLCFDCEERSGQWLQIFSDEIVKRVQDKGGFPPYLNVFPEGGLIPNTEKFILRNFLGYRFLHDGYLVSYELGNLAFDCFLIEGTNLEEAADMLKQYRDAKGAESVQKLASGYLIKDKYYHNIYIAQVNNILCGVMKITDGFEKIGESYLERLIKSVKSR